MLQVPGKKMRADLRLSELKEEAAPYETASE
jgi:hypothetical protein